MKDFTPEPNKEYIIIDNRMKDIGVIAELYSYLGYYKVIIDDGYKLFDDFTDDKSIIGLTTIPHETTELLPDGKIVIGTYIVNDKSIRNKWTATKVEPPSLESADLTSKPFSEGEVYRLYVKKRKAIVRPKAGGRRTKSRRRPRRKNTTKRYKHNS
jgi:hypothetical protein